jgi:nucleoid-associated protein YgaU
MTSRSSRHYGAPTYERSSQGVEIELLEPRFAVRGGAAVMHRVVAGDRIDLLAARYYGDPLQSWRIADANPTLDPHALIVPGRVLVIPRTD